MRFEPDPVWKRLEKYPKWIRDYIHQVQTFVGADEVAEIIFLRDQNKALIKLVAELKAENRRLKKRTLRRALALDADKCELLAAAHGAKGEFTDARAALSKAWRSSGKQATGVKP